MISVRFIWGRPEHKGAQAFLREGWGLHLLPSLSPGPSTLLALGCSTMTLKCLPQIYMLCKRMSPEVLIWRNGSWGDLSSAAHLVLWHFNFCFKTDGSFVHGESLGMLNPVVLPPKWWQSCQDHCRRLTPSPPPRLIPWSRRAGMVNLPSGSCWPLRKSLA